MYLKMFATKTCNCQYFKTQMQADAHISTLLPTCVVRLYFFSFSSFSAPRCTIKKGVVSEGGSEDSRSQDGFWPVGVGVTIRPNQSSRVTDISGLDDVVLEVVVTGEVRGSSEVDQLTWQFAVIIKSLVNITLCIIIDCCAEHWKRVPTSNNYFKYKMLILDVHWK